MFVGVPGSGGLYLVQFFQMLFSELRFFYKKIRCIFNNEEA